METSGSRIFHGSSLSLSLWAAGRNFSTCLGWRRSLSAAASLKTSQSRKQQIQKQKKGKKDR